MLSMVSLEDARGSLTQGGEVGLRAPLRLPIRIQSPNADVIHGGRHQPKYGSLVPKAHDRDVEYVTGGDPLNITLLVLDIVAVHVATGELPRHRDRGVGDVDGPWWGEDTLGFACMCECVCVCGTV